MDLLEIDAASNRGIDAIRDLRERLNYAPTDLKRKVYILDEAHQITKDAWNALLKSLEEPPEFVVFMFASTHPQDFPPAILSRLQRFDVRRLTTEEIEGKLARILEVDGRLADPDALHLIARLAAGGMRDAESMLDQLLSAGGDHIDEATVRDLLGLAATDAIAGFVAAIVAGDVAAGVRILDELEDRGRDLRAFLDQIIEVLRSGMLSADRETMGVEGGPARADLVRVARRLAVIDPNRAGIGGLRLQLELALFPDEVVPAVTLPRVAAVRSAPAAVVPPSVPVAETSSHRPPRAEPEAASPTAAPVPEPASTPAPPAGARAAAKVPPVADQQTHPRDASPTGAPVMAADVVSPPPPATGAAVGSDLDILRQRWPEVVARVSAHPPTKPLIGVCRPISVADGIVTLGFPEDQGFLRDVAERRRSILEEGIAAVLGRPVGVRCVATNLDLIPELPVDAEAAFVLAEARRIFGSDAPDVAEVG